MKKPMKPYDSYINVSPVIQAFLSSLTPEQLTESVDICCYHWSAKMVRRVVGNLKPKQRALCNHFGMHSCSGIDLAELQKELGFNSAEETEQAFADLRTQLRAMGIHPQEVYHINFYVRNEARPPDILYFGNQEFAEGWDEARAEAS